MWFWSLTLACLIVLTVQVEETEDEQACVNKLVTWCKGTSYPSANDSDTMIWSITTMRDGHTRTSCTMDYEGVTCSRNRHKWFTCSPHGMLTYKGKILVEGSLAGADSQICNTSNIVFNDLKLQNMAYNKTVIDGIIKQQEEQMKGMFARLQSMWKGFLNFFTPNSGNTTETNEIETDM